MTTEKWANSEEFGAGERKFNTLFLKIMGEHNDMLDKGHLQCCVFKQLAKDIRELTEDYVNYYRDIQDAKQTNV